MKTKNPNAFFLTEEKSRWFRLVAWWMLSRIFTEKWNKDKSHLNYYCYDAEESLRQVQSWNIRRRVAMWMGTVPIVGWIIYIIITNNFPSSEQAWLTTWLLILAEVVMLISSLVYIIYSSLTRPWHTEVKAANEWRRVKKLIRKTTLVKTLAGKIAKLEQPQYHSLLDGQSHIRFVAEIVGERLQELQYIAINHVGAGRLIKAHNIQRRLIDPLQALASEMGLTKEHARILQSDTLLQRNGAIAGPLTA